MTSCPQPPSRSPGRHPQGWSSGLLPGSHTQETLQQLLKEGKRVPVPRHPLGSGASSNLSRPFPPACSGFKQVSFEELKSGASPSPPESVCCAYRSTSRDWGVGRWGASLSGHTWQPGPRPGDQGPQHSNKPHSQRAPPPIQRDDKWGVLCGSTPEGMGPVQP